MAPQPSRPRGPFSGLGSGGGLAPAAPLRSSPTSRRWQPLPGRAPLAAGRCRPGPALRNSAGRRPCPASPPATGAARRLLPAAPRPLRRRGQGSTNAKEKRAEGSGTRRPAGQGALLGIGAQLRKEPLAPTTGKENCRGARHRCDSVHCTASLRQLPTACPGAGTQSHTGTGSQSRKVCSSLTKRFRKAQINCSISSARRSGRCTGRCTGSCTRQNRLI